MRLKAFVWRQSSQRSENMNLNFVVSLKLQCCLSHPEDLCPWLALCWQWFPEKIPEPMTDWLKLHWSHRDSHTAHSLVTKLSTCSILLHSTLRHSEKFHQFYIISRKSVWIKSHCKGCAQVHFLFHSASRAPSFCDDPAHSSVQLSLFSMSWYWANHHSIKENHYLPMQHTTGSS